MRRTSARTPSTATRWPSVAAAACSRSVHQEIIKTPKQARNTLAYVLNNWRKHREDRDGLPATWNVDPFSTGVLFEGWKERADEVVYMPYRDTYQPMIVYLAKTWLLSEGWRKHGLIGFCEVPSAKQMGQLPR